MTTKVNRIFEYDMLRIIAVVAVVMIHCAAPYEVTFSANTNEFFVGNFFTTVSQIGVPFFLFLSGTFMLDETKKLPVEKLRYKIIKLIIILAVWSAFYALCYDAHHFLKAFIYGHYHLWYMYMIIGLYLITPILRLFVKKENEKYVWYFVSLAMIFQFIPNLIAALWSKGNALLKLSQMFYMSFVSGIGSYYLLGWLIKINSEKLVKYKNTFIILSFFTLSALVTLINIKTAQTANAYSNFYNHTNILLFVYCISAFISLKLFFEKIGQKVNDKVKNIVATLSNLTFGVYLVHAASIHLMDSIMKHSSIEFFGLKLLIHFVAVTILSFLICFILSKIKYINQLIKI